MKKTFPSFGQKRITQTESRDWSHIYPYYHDDIVFHDSIQKIEGKDNFIALCERLTKRCKQLKMDIHTIIMKDNVNTI